MEIITKIYVQSSNNIKFLFIGFIFVLSGINGFAQGTQNPFDIGKKNVAQNTDKKQNTAINTEYPELIVDLSEDSLETSKFLDKSNNGTPVSEDKAKVNTPEDVKNSTILESNLQETTSEKVRTRLNLSQNPFDVSSSGASPKKKPILDAPKNNKPKKEGEKNILGENPNEQGSREVVSSGFLFSLVIIMTVLFAVLLTLFRPFFGKIYQAFISDSQLRAAHREMGSSLSPPYYFMYFMFLLNASIFVYVILQYFNISVGIDWLSILYILGGLSAVFLGKHLLVLFIGLVFPVSKEIAYYNFTIVVFNIMLGIFFVPLSLFLAYVPENLSIVVFYFALAVILLTYLYRIFRVLLISGNYISFHKFHFFMYLCTAEIAPLIIVVKFLQNNYIN